MSATPALAPTGNVWSIRRTNREIGRITERNCVRERRNGRGPGGARRNLALWAQVGKESVFRQGGALQAVEREKRDAGRGRHNRAMAKTGLRALTALLLWAAAGVVAGQTQDGAGEWVPLFDGKSLQGWKETSYSGRGVVQVKAGTIELGAGRTTGITWAGEFPKSDYEIRFEAVRIQGRDFFAGLTFPVKESFCTWINGGWGGTVVGLSNLDGDDASENETSTVHEFVTGRWYSFRLRVTAERISGWIDGAMVIDADISGGRRVDLRFGEEDLATPLGFASYATVAGLRKMEYRRLSR